MHFMLYFHYSVCSYEVNHHVMTIKLQNIDHNYILYLYHASNWLALMTLACISSNTCRLFPSFESLSLSLSRSVSLRMLPFCNMYEQFLNFTDYTNGIYFKLKLSNASFLNYEVYDLRSAPIHRLMFIFHWDNINNNNSGF